MAGRKLDQRELLSPNEMYFDHLSPLQVHLEKNQEKF